MPYMYVPKPNFVNSPFFFFFYKKKNTLFVFKHSRLQSDKIIHFCYGM